MQVYSLIEHKDLTNYIASLPKSIIEKIFYHPTTCLAVFRELPELAKIFVTRLLLLNQEVPQETVNSWINSKHKEKTLNSTKILTNLGVLNDVSSQGGMPAWVLKPSFRDNLFEGMFNVQVNQPCDQQATAESEFLDKLDNYALERWESVLKYIVNPRDAKNQIGNSTKEVLKFAGLMKQVSSNESRTMQSYNEATDEMENNEPVTLTASAFQFLLWNRRVQIWYFIIQLLEYCWQKNGQDISECLTLLFELSFSTFGKDYSCEEFSPTKVDFLQELRKLGLVFMKTRKIKRFYPTRLAIQLSNGINNADSDNKDEKGYIIVETNYRIYAYTDSHLKISLLALFSELLYRFPNMVVASITRESAREAYKIGITSQQIINFLRGNAHPQIARRKPMLPETITDQLNFWFNERNRLTLHESVFYGQFNSVDDFFFLKNYAKDLDAIIWSNDQKRIMVVKKTAHDMIKKYWKQNKPK